MITRNKDEMREKLTRISEQMRLTGENIEKTKTDMEEIDSNTKTNTSERKKFETPLRVARRNIRTKEEGIDSLKTELDSFKTEIEEEVNGKMKPDIENKIRRISRSIKKIEDIHEGKTSITYDMGNKRILNLPPPRDPEKSTENYNDPVTVKYLYDAMNDFSHF